MTVLLKCGALFIHVPKTGGNWVADVLEDNNLVFAHVAAKHTIPEHLEPLEKFFRLPFRYAKPNKTLFKFCFVRHPLRWYESWYKMMSSLNWPLWGTEPDYWNPTANIDGLGAPSFDEFISNVLSRRRGFVTEMYESYTRGIHFVGRQEHIAEDLLTVLRHLEVDFDVMKMNALGPVNVSEKMSLTWRPDLQEAMENAELEAFHRFGYKTELYREELQSIVGFQGGLNQEIFLERPFAHETGYGWRAMLPRLASYGDSLENPHRSRFILHEDGRAIMHRHALHADICETGSGRYSHWGDYLLFSTSDNTDPNTNGRQYRIKAMFGDGATTDSLLLKP